MNIDKNKTYKTRDGREVEIYAIRSLGCYPIHGAVETSEGVWLQKAWARAGDASYYETADFSNKRCDKTDLIEVKPRIKRKPWFNIYPEGMSSNYDSKEAANASANSSRIACIKVEIDCSEGEGLNDE